MAILPKTDKKFHQVRSIFGHGDTRQTAIERYSYIPNGGMNDVIKQWHEKQQDRPFVAASPSQISLCPRVVWLKKHGVAPLQTQTWALKQRLLLGRLFENQFADELAEAGMLLHHWKDDPGIVVPKFTYGNPGDPTYFEGVPDYLVQLKDTIHGDVVAISDAKTSRSDSYGYVPINDMEIWTDGGWYKNRMQLTGYYILCHSPAGQAWFKANNLPLPTHCHLFNYALDDGVVRREVLWQPTQADIDEFLRYTRRFNHAFNATVCPECTCGESLEGFAIKFCDYGVKADGAKICESCCDDSLIPGGTT